MRNAIINYLLENYPTLAVFVIILIVVGFLVYKVTTLINKSVQYNNKVDNLPCEERRIINDSNYTSLKDEFSTISTLIAEIHVFLKVKHKAADIFSTKRSPTTLNEIGKSIFKEINGKSFIEDNKDIARWQKNNLFGLL